MEVVVWLSCLVCGGRVPGVEVWHGGRQGSPERQLQVGGQGGGVLVHEAVGVQVVHGHAALARRTLMTTTTTTRVGRAIPEASD